MRISLLACRSSQFGGCNRSASPCDLNFQLFPAAVPIGELEARFLVDGTILYSTPLTEVELSGRLLLGPIVGVALGYARFPPALRVDAQHKRPR
jgi:hypothetical protein